MNTSRLLTIIRIDDDNEAPEEVKDPTATYMETQPDVSVEDQPIA
jgi:hypothetical protein